MKAKVSYKNPEQAEITMNITATVAEWKEIHKAFNHELPIMNKGFDIRRFICNSIDAFYKSIEQELTQAENRL